MLGPIPCLYAELPHSVFTSGKIAVCFQTFCLYYTSGIDDRMYNSCGRFRSSSVAFFVLALLSLCFLCFFKRVLRKELQLCLSVQHLIAQRKCKNNSMCESTGILKERRTGKARWSKNKECTRTAPVGRLQWLYTHSSMPQLQQRQCGWKWMALLPPVQIHARTFFINKQKNNLQNLHMNRLT